MADFCHDEPAVLFKEKVCLSAISKNGKGKLTRKDHVVQECKKPPCKTLKTIHHLAIKWASHKPCDSKPGVLLNGSFVVERFVTAYTDGDGNKRGVHSGDFIWTGSGVVVKGRMAGMTNAGTHRKPIFADCQPCDAHGYMEGRLCGEVVETTHDGLKRCHVTGTYRIHFDPSVSGGEGAITATFEGDYLCHCE